MNKEVQLPCRCSGLPAATEFQITFDDEPPGGQCRATLALVSAPLVDRTPMRRADGWAGASALAIPRPASCTLGVRFKAPSTLGTFLYRWAMNLLDRREPRACWPGPGSGVGRAGDAPFTIDLDSTICETYGLDKEGARHHGYTGARGYHPLNREWPSPPSTGECLMARMREGRALHRVAGASGPTSCRETVGRVAASGVDSFYTPRLAVPAFRTEPATRRAGTPPYRAFRVNVPHSGLQTRLHHRPFSAGIPDETSYGVEGPPAACTALVGMMAPGRRRIGRPRLLRRRFFSSHPLSDAASPCICHIGHPVQSASRIASAAWAYGRANSVREGYSLPTARVRPPPCCVKSSAALIGIGPGPFA